LDGIGLSRFFLVTEEEGETDKDERNYAHGRRAANKKRSLATARSHRHRRRRAPPDSQAHITARRRVLSSASVQASSLFLLSTFYRDFAPPG
jgi:hypothetical protein